jgi:hypothetical protein
MMGLGKQEADVMLLGQASACIVLAPIYRWFARPASRPSAVQMQRGRYRQNTFKVILARVFVCALIFGFRRITVWWS